MKLIPLFDRVVIQHIESHDQEKPQMATVISVGEGGVIDGKEIKMVVRPGDVVLYGKYAGSEFKIDGEEFIVIRQSDILAKVEK